MTPGGGRGAAGAAAHQCPAATDLEAKRKANLEISRRFLARRGPAQERIDWLRQHGGQWHTRL
jgi:hypothetical protein